MVPAAIVDTAGTGKPDAAPKPVSGRTAVGTGARPGARTGIGGESMAARIRRAP